MKIVMISRNMYSYFVDVSKDYYSLNAGSFDKVAMIFNLSNNEYLPTFNYVAYEYLC